MEESAAARINTVGECFHHIIVLMEKRSGRKVLQRDYVWTVLCQIIHDSLRLDDKIKITCDTHFVRDIGG